MSELLYEVNWMLICALIALSILVSFIGDVVGMKLGKKRITLLGLRPKYTSRIISVLTGLGIAVVVMVGLSLASEQVRTALFSMQFVQRQLLTMRDQLRTNQDTMYKMEVDLLQSRGDLSDRERELDSVSTKLKEEMDNLQRARSDLANMRAERAKTEAEQEKLTSENQKLTAESKKLEASVNKLRKESETLKQGIQKLRTGRIAAFSEEILAQSIAEYSPVTERQMNDHIARMRTWARDMLAYRFGKKPSELPLPQISSASLTEAKNKVINTNGRWLLRLSALGNLVDGDSSIQVRLDARESKLVYKSGDVLFSHKFAPNTKQQDVEQVIYMALKSMNGNAASDGVLRDPITGDVGSLDSNELMDAIEHISKSSKETTIEIFAAKDVYTEGPLAVNIRLR
ncbi:MAG: DUF3084 domain-containing protein [Synergistes sp.]|nr:DUF3084 domain-containing protein [Synergistes sp.]